MCAQPNDLRFCCGALWTASARRKRIDVYPDGTAYDLDETIRRLCFREGYDRQVCLQDDGVVEVKLSPLFTSSFCAPGHRIRIEVSSSSFPRFTGNLNTEGALWSETEGVVANNAMHHSAVYPSVVRLPIAKR